MALLGLFSSRKPAAAGPEAALYQAIVGQARREEFYRRQGVPDTVDGRFDLIALHAFLVMEPLAGRDPALAQALFDHMFADFDINLREMGVSDVMLGRRIKKLAQAFLGRSEAYRQALARPDDADLIAALDRNLYAKVKAEPAALAAMALYVRREALALEAGALAEGRLFFGPPPGLPA
jgi:cytochrome b pre-mRNA-processing protein 3